MAKGFIDVEPSILPCISAWLPLGITVVSSNPYGGAQRLEIQGDEVEDGEGYQLVTTNSPMSRTIELVKNPHG